MCQKIYIAIANLMFLATVLAVDCEFFVYDVASLNNNMEVNDLDIKNRWKEMTGVKFQARVDRDWGKEIDRIEGGLCDKKKTDAQPLQIFIAKLLTEVSGLSNCWLWEQGGLKKGSAKATLPCDDVANRLVKSGSKANIVIALINADGVGLGEYTGTLVKA